MLTLHKKLSKPYIPLLIPVAVFSLKSGHPCSPHNACKYRQVINTTPQYMYSHMLRFHTHSLKKNMVADNGLFDAALEIYCSDTYILSISISLALSSSLLLFDFLYLPIAYAQTNNNSKWCKCVRNCMIYSQKLTGCAYLITNLKNIILMIQDINLSQKQWFFCALIALVYLR